MNSWQSLAGTMADGADNTLIVVLDGRQVGTLVQDRAGQLVLTYDDAWRDLATATPLSLSLPLARRMHRGPVVRAFLEGLLPDSDRVLERWARAYQVSARNPFALLRHVGEDCAGAAQFVRQDRVEALVAETGGVEWLSEEELSRRLRTLDSDPTAWHLSRTGQFSLAGAQAKTALCHDPETGRWGQPWGAIPTTHILKPAIAGLADHDVNEYLCLAAARHLGLNAVRSQLCAFGDQHVIVVERYDRRRKADGRIGRVHQEDLCQALGVPPTMKYQNEGGPTPEQITELLGLAVQPAPLAVESIQRFVDALAFNWVIAGTDAHAKNYSLLHLGQAVRLAPLYDLASALPYDDMYVPKLRSAMRIGGEYRIGGIGGRQWRRFAADNHLEAADVVARVADLTDRIVDAFDLAAQDPAVIGSGSSLPARLLGEIVDRVAWCEATLS